MNMKRIEFAAKGYEQSADEGARKRVAAFKPIWEAQHRAAEKASEALAADGWAAPAADDLERWYWEGAPLLSHAPVKVDAGLFAQTARDVAGAALGGMGIAGDAREALASCDWDALIAQTPLETAGKDPASYLDASADVVERVCGENGDLVFLVLALALRPMVEPAAAALFAAVKPRVQGGLARHRKPRACPVCGGEPSLAYVGPTDTNKANGRTLYCAQCGTTWEFERVRCARCGNQLQDQLHYKSVEGDDAHRLHVCDACKGYMRTLFMLDNSLRPFTPEVEDAVMANLDAVAASLGLGPTGEL